MTETRRSGPRACGLAVLVALVAVAPAGRGEDRLTVRGAYYREHSTRVVQPMVQITKDLPRGFDVGAHFLVDAITSASIAAGVMQDQLFTELRKEAGAAVGKTWDRTRMGVSYRQSREPDYISHALGLSVSQGVWDNTGSIGINVARGFDTVGPNLNLPLDVYFGGVSYSQALAPTLLAQVGYEVIYLDGSLGSLGNPYSQVPNHGRERPPDERLRHAAIARTAYYLPASGTGLQLHYRFYFDHAPGLEPQAGAPENPWNVVAHTVDVRLHQELTAHLELRLGYRFHSQGAAAFWCNTDPSRGGRTDCYPPEAPYFVVDAKLGPVTTHVPELKLWWEAHALRTIPVLGWLAGGAFELSYAHFIQDTRYENAHVLQTGYSLPF